MLERYPEEGRTANELWELMEPENVLNSKTHMKDVLHTLRQKDYIRTAPRFDEAKVGLKGKKGSG